MSKRAQSKSDKMVVIIGAGYGGIALTKALQKDYSVTLIEPRDHFFHAIGLPRASVDLTFAEQSMLWPHERIFRPERDAAEVVHQAATRVNTEDHTVVVADGSVIPYDVLVIACGARNVGALKEKSLFDRGAALTAMRERIKACKTAKKVVVVGGGAVGVETAAEIASRYGTCDVALVHSGPHLLESRDAAKNRYSGKFHRKLNSKLAELPNLEVICNDRVARQEGASEESVTLESGRKLDDVDLVIWAVGLDFGEHGGLLEPFVMGKNGLKTNAHLQLEGFDNVFGIGDVIDVPNERKLAISAQEHAGLVAKNVRAVLEKKALKSYKPNRKGPMDATQMIMVPLGEHRGAGILGKFVLGSILTHKFKGKDYFAKQMQGDMGM